MANSRPASVAMAPVKRGRRGLIYIKRVAPLYSYRGVWIYTDYSLGLLRNSTKPLWHIKLPKTFYIHAFAECSKKPDSSARPKSNSMKKTKLLYLVRCSPDREAGTYHLKPIKEKAQNPIASVCHYGRPLHLRFARSLPGWSIRLALLATPFQHYKCKGYLPKIKIKSEKRLKHFNCSEKCVSLQLQRSSEHGNIAN